MAILLSQHGKSASKDVDPQRGLTREGREEVAAVARVLRDSGVAVGAIWHSGKTRAEQTAALFAEAMGLSAGIASRDGLDPLDDVVVFAESLPKDADVLIVGHLPFMERLVSYLVTGDAEGRVVRFQNGGVVRMDWDRDGERWLIGWTVFPTLRVD